MIPCVCPSCTVKLQAPDAAAGQKLKCPNCKNSITVPRAANMAVSAKPPARRPAANTSPGQKSRSTPPTANKSSTTVPKSKSKPQYDDVEIDEVDEAPVRGKSKKKGKKAPKSEFPWLLVGIGGGAGLVVLLLVGGLMFLMMGSKEGPKRDGPVAAQKGGKGNAPGDKAKAVPEQPQPPPEPVAVVKQFDGPKGPLPDSMAQETLHKVKKATVKLRVKTADGRSGEGSGFFAIDKNLVVTNAHVLGMLHSKESPKSIDIVLNSGEKDEFSLTGTILGVDHDADLAILRLIGGDPSKIPPPLLVDSVSTPTELQKVYIFGFPLGSLLGKSMTINESQISSLRRNDDGHLSKLQVRGGMEPGNSGGPVVDSRGNVVGVSVSIIKGTLLNFAVPAEKVQQLSQGRVLSTEFGYSFRTGGTSVLPIKLSCLDPLEQISKIEIDYWAGSNDPSRPTNSSTSARRPTDGPKQTAVIQYADGEGKGDLQLPAIPMGQTLWAQPVLYLNSNHRVYGQAIKASAAASAPLDRKPANLTLNLAKVAERTLDVSTKQHWQFVNQNQEVTKKLDADFLEVVTARDGDFAMSLSPGKVEVTGAMNEQSMTVDPQSIDLLRKFNFGFSLGSTGKVLEVANPVWNMRVNPAITEQANELVSMFRNAYEITSLNLPNKQMQPMETWSAAHTLLLNAGRGRKVAVDVTLKCTFEGVRGDKDALIRVEGSAQPKSVATIDANFGKISGYVLVDTERGFISKSQITMRSEADLGELFMVSTVEMNVTRIAGNPRNIKPVTTAPGTSTSTVLAGVQPVGAGTTVLEKTGRWRPADPKHPKSNAGHQVVTVNLTAGKAYVFDLMMTAKKIVIDQTKGEYDFDPYLIIENPAGNIIAENDDDGMLLDSHIALRARETGQYRIIVTACRGDAREGGFKLRVGELDVSDFSPSPEPKNVPKGKLAPKKAAFNDIFETRPLDVVLPIHPARLECWQAASVPGSAWERTARPAPAGRLRIVQALQL